MDEQVLSNEDTGVIVVDVQADFTELKSGTLAVPGTDVHYIKAVETATRKFLQMGLPVYCTQDWHPADHMSFDTNNPGAALFDTIEINDRPQIIWPAHCIQQSEGAQIIIQKDALKKVVQKGSDPDFDSYSGFADDQGKKTQLEELLKTDGITDLIIYGLATDVCVKATVLDAIKADFRVTLLEDLCRGVVPQNTTSAIEQMSQKGAVIADKSTIISQF